jgi:hypothetical protein
MVKIFLIVCLIASISAQPEVEFKTDSNHITFHANWHPDIRELSQEISIFKQ